MGAWWVAAAWHLPLRHSSGERQAELLGPAECHVQVLDGLARAAFHKVIYRARNDYGALFIGGNAQVAEVGMRYHGHARGVYQPDELLAAVGLLIKVDQLRRARC